MFDPKMRGSVWNSNVNTIIGAVFIGTCALWAANFIFQVTWGENPVANGMAAIITEETMLPPQVQ